MLGEVLECYWGHWSAVDAAPDFGLPVKDIRKKLANNPRDSGVLAWLDFLDVEC